MFRKFFKPFVVLCRSLRGFAEVHPAVYTFNPQRDSARSKIEVIF